VTAATVRQPLLIQHYLLTFLLNLLILYEVVALTFSVDCRAASATSLRRAFAAFKIWLRKVSGYTAALGTANSCFDSHKRQLLMPMNKQGFTCTGAACRAQWRCCVGKRQRH
jgi:hypothetical protein